MKNHFNDFEVGDISPKWERVTGPMEWNRFAAANDEFYLVHMDDQVAIAAENPEGMFGMGQMRVSYIHNAIRDWLGDEIEVMQVSCRYTAINQKNDNLATTLKVIEKITNEADEKILKLEVDVFRQDGTSTTPGFALVKLPQ